MLAFIQVILWQFRCHRRCEQKSNTANAEKAGKAIGDAPGAASALQANDVITRNELLAMMPQGKQRARETGAAYAWAVMPCSSLARDAPSSPTRARRAKEEVVLFPVEVPIAPPAPTPAPPPPDAEATVAADEKGDFQRRVLLAAQKLAGLGEKAGPEVMSLMQELEELAERIAKADEMRSAALALAPSADGDAGRWQEVAMVTLSWSQQELLKRQKAALNRLIEIAEQTGRKGRGGRGGAAAPPPRPSSPTLDAAGQMVPWTPPESLVDEKSMKRDLEALRLHDPDCILIVRRIKMLGWESPALLRKYFAQHGKVCEIFVTHSTMKPNPKRPGGRARPAANGFIVMADKEGKAAVLSHGQEQWVTGVAIHVAAFNPFLDSSLEEATE